MSYLADIWTSSSRIGSIFRCTVTRSTNCLPAYKLVRRACSTSAQLPTFGHVHVGGRRRKKILGFAAPVHVARRCRADVTAS